MHVPSVGQSGQSPSVKLGQLPSPELLCPMFQSSLAHRDAKWWETKAARVLFQVRSLRKKMAMLEICHFYYLVMVLSSYLPAYQGACLPPDLSPGRLKSQVQKGKHANVDTQSCTQIHA